MEKPSPITPIEVPSWHLELPQHWPQISYDPPESIRRYGFRPWPTEIPPPKRARRRRAKRRRSMARARPWKAPAR